MLRDAIFISHANPDDNDFVKWLGSRLTGYGYRVWADLFDLKGGTPFWKSIEEAIRSRAIKVVFVVSKTSVDPNRTGVRNELSVSDTVRKALKDDAFIIPVRIDETPFGDFPIQVHQLNAIDFSRGWGAKLNELLDTLRDAGVPKASTNLSLELDSWRAAVVRTAASVEERPETVVSNLLPAILPTHITFHDYKGDNRRAKAAFSETKIPHAFHNRLVIAFAEASQIQLKLPPDFSVAPRAVVKFDDFLQGAVEEVSGPVRGDARNIATSLLRQHIERYLESRGLKRFETSSSAGYYFPSDLLPNNKVGYIDAQGRRTHKNVVGRSDKRRVLWHLAMKVNVVLGPPCLVRFKPYICFSDIGGGIITDRKRAGAIRRGFCKSWWNIQWRQLQQAFSAFLANGENHVVVPLQGAEAFVLGSKLLEFTATRTMPWDLKFNEDVEEPEDLGDDVEDHFEDEIEDDAAEETP